MKALRLCMLILALSILVLTCEKDEPHYSVNAFESALHNNVSDYRVSEGLSPLVWNADIFVEAREQSIAWKNSGDPSTGINERLGIIQDHWEPENLGVITSSFNGKADTSSARLVLEAWIADPTIDSILVGDFVQSGAGIAEKDGTVYITHFLMKVVTK